jgi:hypothetical protein
MRRLIYILGCALMVVVLFSCEKKFDLKMGGEKIIFVECFPGIKDFIALKVLPALPLNCDYDINRFSPDVKLMVNGDMVEVKYMEQGDSLRGIPAGYWVAEYAPLPDDKVKVVVSADGFETVESESVVPIPLSDYRLDYEVYDATQGTKAVIKPAEYVGPEPNYNLWLNVRVEVKDSPKAGDAYGIQFVRETISTYVNFLGGVQRDTSVYYSSGVVPDMSDTPLLPQTSTILNVKFDGISCNTYDGVIMFLDRKFNGGSVVLEAVNTYSQGFTIEEKDETGRHALYSEKCRYKIRIYRFTSDFSRYAYAQNQIDNNIFGEIGLAPAGYAYSNIKNGAGILAGALMLETDWLDL